MEILTRMKDGTTIIKHKDKYYLAYKLFGRHMEKPWRLVTQPENDELSCFKTEEELCEYVGRI